MNDIAKKLGRAIFNIENTLEINPVDVKQVLTATGCSQYSEVQRYLREIDEVLERREENRFDNHVGALARLYKVREKYLEKNGDARI